ncbi:LacI family DNA-binding transcriptional regulator [Lichenifustis flavocetrariae]|uniref:LacI family DNA-binding transcriptional regulator n=1 Tax=Lichenifustis flavocetrariae TaxID=2949735 RepID=A0AA41YXG0_9HYPH|nr:LacI family DNA-binding transcriptional regulator [Lichenifustis flavocetrariae]MCW6506625.1 LacI family DNA-binding transcriptional regulator [Lichenifustis flavocetrariae]
MSAPSERSKRRRSTGQQPITLSDVAARAKVSEITVSRILRGVGPIADSTRERVMEAVDAMGYVPNRVAGTLASSVSSLVGVIIPSLSNIVFPEVLQGINAGLEPSGYRPVVGITDYDATTEEKLVASLLAWKPAAMIIAGFDHTPMTRRRLQTSGIRIAELMDIDATPIDLAVGLSHRAAGYDTGRHLLRRGYRRFGYVGHDWSADRRAKLRYDGLRQALCDAGHVFAGEAMTQGPSSTGAGRSMLDALLRSSPDVDVAVFSNDDMAVGGVFHCMTAGITPKRDLGLFGFNGLDIGQALPLRLSTIRSNRFLIGRMAVEKMLQQSERPGTPEIIDTGYEIVEGETA